jgi:hypothetical protein
MSEFLDNELANMLDAAAAEEQHHLKANYSQKNTLLLLTRYWKRIVRCDCGIQMKVKAVIMPSQRFETW